MTRTDTPPAPTPTSAHRPRTGGSGLRAPLRQHLAALRALLVLTVLLGLLYPLAMTGIGAVAFGEKADGSLARADGRVVGSTLLGQSFTDPNADDQSPTGKDGNPLPQWFQPRPSAAGAGYDGASSGASNLGPSNPDLLASIAERRAQVARFNGVDPSTVPPDALTASASGLDPDISPAYARLQVERVARVRGLDPVLVSRLVAQVQRGRTIGILGEPRVNVLALNTALAGLR